MRQESWCQPTVRFEAAQQEIDRKQYPVKVKPSGKAGQLSCLVSSFLSKAASRKQLLFTQRLTAWTSLPLTEVEHDQSATFVLSVTTEVVASLQTLT